ncbi:hypothetical protein LIA77_08927 [Sarocladium implicatum]|nr:hypothetical protein LIA77_08927 [Sarocladium implicatum]
MSSTVGQAFRRAASPFPVVLFSQRSGARPASDQGPPHFLGLGLNSHISLRISWSHLRSLKVVRSVFEASDQGPFEQMLLNAGSCCDSFQRLL